MIKQFCLDSNVIIKILIEEEETELAISLANNSSCVFISPLFAKIEVLSVIRNKEKRRQISKEKTDEIVSVFKAAKIDFIREDNELIEESFAMARKLKLPVIYDCIYLTLAKKMNVPFVSADRKFLKYAKKVYPASFSLKEAVKKI